MKAIFLRAVNALEKGAGGNNAYDKSSRHSLMIDYEIVVLARLSP